MRFEPHEYQSLALNWIWGRTIQGGGAALFLDPGLGKTAITLAWLRMLSSLKLHRGALVVAPLRVVYSVWRQERDKWEQFKDLRISLVHGPPAQRLAALAAPADIYLVNPDGVPWLAKIAKDRDLPFDTLVVDESSAFKTWGARRTKSLRVLQKTFRRRLVLTGTPAPNGFHDLFAQIFLVDQGQRLGTAVGQFRNRYFYRGGYGGYKYILMEGADKRIESAIQDVCLRMSAEEYLDLPELVHNDVWVDLPGPILKRYKKLESLMFLELQEGKDLTPLNAGGKYNLCRQFANGGVYDNEDKSISHDIHQGKVEAVREIVGELQGKPVLIAFQYRHDLQRLREVWKDLPSIDGRSSGEEAAVNIERWNAGELPRLAVQPQSLSHGVNMQSGPGRDVIWMGLSDSLETYLQLNARLHRQGVTGQVRIHRILARKTVDAAVRARIESKEKGQGALLEALREYRKKEEAGE